MTESPLTNSGGSWPHSDRSGVHPSDPWTSRWTRLARPLGLAPHTPVALALSGGADSVFLLHLLARSTPRPKVLAIHIDHGLRGDESRADAEFCARACAKLGIPFSRRVAEVDPEASDLEARCRKARYSALAEETRGAGIEVLLTGHHEDDAVETLLMRWMRGTELSGLAGLRRETVLGTGAVHGQRALKVLRPLVALRREEVRSALRSADLEWREDSSNESPRFTRNRVRHQVLPEIEARCGTEGVENFFEFARSVESLEDELADRTAHIHWEDAPHAAARGMQGADSRYSAAGFLGGVVRREALSDLSPPLLRRAIGRLIGEGTGKRPNRDVLARIATDVAEGNSARQDVHGGWSVQIKSDGLHLNPPVETSGGTATAAPPATGTQRQTLQVPGSVTLPDGRKIHASIAEDGVIDAEETVAVLDADAVGTSLAVRFERPGDRIHPLGAPGHKPLRRFLGEVGVPREERGNVPIVVAGEEVVWVAGIRPAEPFRVTQKTRRRIRLSLA